MTASGSENTYRVDIKVLGVGGGGCNAVDRMISSGMEGVEFVAMNTDLKSLRSSRAHKIIQLGEKTTKGLGAGAKPEVGEKAALESEEQIRKAVSGADMVFITAGMGGGTGTGAAPVVARVARELDILTVGIVTKPFSFEGSKRMENAVAGIEKLRKELDSIIVILNSNLMEASNENLSLTEGFNLADEILKCGVQGITGTINTPGMINLDFADVRTIMKGKGAAHIGVGLGKGRKKAEDAAERAINSFLLETTIDGATGLLINITGGNEMSIHEVEGAVRYIRNHAHRDAEVIFGAAIESGLQDEMCVTLIATGFEVCSESNENRPHDSQFFDSKVTYLEIPSFLRYRKSKEGIWSS